MQVKTFAAAIAVLVLACSAHDGRSAESPMRLTSAPTASVRTPWPHPLGSSVLYDQSGVETTNVVAEYFTDFPTFRSQLADDFVVTDASNWTVLSVVVQENTSQATNLPDTLYNVSIFPDNGGSPASEAVCDYANLTPSFDVTNTIATIPLLPLSQSCVLVPGTYWLTATPAIDFASGGYFFASLGDTGATIGSVPVWRNPGGAYGGGCPDWTAIDSCTDLGGGFTATDSMLFQIVGHTGGQPGSIDLSVGLAEDNGDASQCGTSTDLSATVGDQINFCYTVVNNSPLTLNFQSLSDTVSGVIFSYEPTVIEPGASYQFNRIITAVATEAPMATWLSSVSLPGYAFSAGAYDFLDITASGTPLDLGDDDGADVTMPFPITFGDTTSDALCINNNGIIFVGVTGACSGYFFNFPLPATQLPAPAIMPFWDDLYGAGNVYYATTGVAPNRQFVIEYYDKNSSSVVVVPGYTFEVVLNESDGSIDFNYANVTVDGDSGHSNGLGASVALQLGSGLANIYSENVASLSNGQNIHWEFVADPIAFSRSQSVLLDVGAPTISALPSPISDTAVAGTSVQTPLYLLNTGNRDLNWSVVSAPGAGRSEQQPALFRPHTSQAKPQIGLLPIDQRPGTAPSKGRVSFGADVVPAFGVAIYATGNQYVDFDASAPGALNEVAPVTNTFVAGTFANFDFTTEFVVDSATGDLYSISTSDGAQDLIGPTGVPSGETVTGIAWDATSGAAYLMSASCTDDIGSDFSTLYSLDLATGATSAIGSLSVNCNVGLAIDPTSGAMYTIELVFGSVNGIDKSTGFVTSLAILDVTLSGPQGLAFDASTETLYLAGFDGATATMYTLNPASGTTNNLGTIGSGAQLGAFAIATLTPPCQRPGEIPWLSQSATDGTVGPALYSTVDLTMDASSLTEGTYSATLCVHSNDPQHPLIVVPVSFAVTGGLTTDSIFVDGFDGS